MYLVYGLSVDNGELVHVDNVPNGVNCRCVCSACGEPLIAKQGSVRKSHFAHMNSECANANESALHLAVKNILNEHKKLWLPIIEFDEKILFAPKVIDLTNTRVERWLDGFRPDIICEYQSPQHSRPVQLIVEVAVTSFIDKDKASRIRDKGISAVEINLSEVERIPNHDYLVNLITNKNTLTEWIHSVKLERESEKASTQRNNEITAHPQREELLEYLTKLADFKLNHRSCQQSTNNILFRMANLISYNPNNVPDIFNVECPNDYVFGCDRRVWQSAFYYEFFIHKQRYLGGGWFKSKDAYYWIKDNVPDVNIPHFVSKLSYAKYSIYRTKRKGGYPPGIIPPPLTEIELEQIPSPIDTVEFYLDKLCEFGLLEVSSYRRGQNEYKYTGKLQI